MTALEYLSLVSPFLALIVWGWFMTQPTPRKSRPPYGRDNTGQSIGEVSHMRTPTCAEIERGQEVQELANFIRFGEKVRSPEYMEVPPYHYQEWKTKEYQQALADEADFMKTMPKTKYNPKTGRPVQQ